MRQRRSPTDRKRFEEVVPRGGVGPRDLTDDEGAHLSGQPRCAFRQCRYGMDRRLWPQCGAPRVARMSVRAPIRMVVLFHRIARWRGRQPRLVPATKGCRCGLHRCQRGQVRGRVCAVIGGPRGARGPRRATGDAPQRLPGGPRGGRYEGPCRHGSWSNAATSGSGASPVDNSTPQFGG